MTQQHKKKKFTRRDQIKFPFLKPKEKQFKRNPALQAPWNLRIGEFHEEILNNHTKWGENTSTDTQK